MQAIRSGQARAYQDASKQWIADMRRSAQIEASDLIVWADGIVLDPGSIGHDANFTELRD